MYITNSDVWLAVAIFLVTVLFTKIARRRISNDTLGTNPLPPVVKSIALLELLPLLFTKGLKSVLHSLYMKFGSVFTISFFWTNTTFLIGPEVSDHFFHGRESEISQGSLLEFTVPMFGKEVGYGTDTATRNEQSRFSTDALKPLKLRSNVAPMLQEVEDYFSKWGEHGTVDMNYELERILMLISFRCLLGKEVREKMFDEVYSLFRDVEKGTNLVSAFFPYIPIPVNRRRDRARVKLGNVIGEIVRSRKSSGRVEEDALQKMIDSKYKNGRSTTEAEVVGITIGLVVAGRYTSSHTSSWTGAYLLSSPKWLAAAVEEQDQVRRKHNGHIDYNAIVDMEILHNCIKEALRLHPVAPVLARKAYKRFTVRTKEGTEYDIPAGHTIASPTVLNNSVPYIYKDAHVFDPDRFGPQRAEDKAGGKLAYTSFSAGKHACIGEAYSYMQIKVVWSHLISNFELELVSPFPEAERNFSVPKPNGKIMVSYKRRQLS